MLKAHVSMRKLGLTARFRPKVQHRIEQRSHAAASASSDTTRISRRALFWEVHQPVLMLTVYADDAGKAQEHDYVLTSAYIGLVAQWERFCSDWRLRLARAGLSEFHANEFFNGAGIFAGVGRVIARWKRLTKECGTLVYEPTAEITADTRHLRIEYEQVTAALDKARLLKISVEDGEPWVLNMRLQRELMERQIELLEQIVDLLKPKLRAEKPKS
jgi:hypothetical protein